jgi:AraC-like DNA-binding protein
MSEFASAAMLRLIRLGLARQGLAWPQAWQLPPRGAHVTFEHKRTLAIALWQAFGPDVVMRIGEGVQDAPDEPVLAALWPARDAAELIERWQRLERFVHSRHRVVAQPLSAGGLALRHVSRDPAVPPHPAEDLLVFGLLVALAEARVAPGLQARLAGEGAWRRAAGRWCPAPWPQDLGHWEWRWDPGDKPRLDRPAAWADAQPELAVQARRALAADPSRGWSVARLAATLALSPRSLQRHLAAGGTGFCALLVDVRTAHAAQLLASGSVAPAEAAYLSGFADQAHLGRAFKQATALTPAGFRARFAAAR